MTLQDLINRVAPQLLGLASSLESIVAQYPDTSPILQPKIDALRAASDPIKLAELGKVVLDELTKFVTTGQVDPRQHPSDLA